MVWATNYKNVAFPNTAALGLTAPQLAEIEDAANDFAAAYTAAETSKLMTQSLVATKDAQRAASEEVLRRYGQMILNNPTVSITLKGQLGLTISPTPFAPVATPIDLLATPYANGAVVVKWDRNGNAKSTAYALEAKYGVSETWVPVMTTGKTKVSLTGFTPGDQVTFRVFANRGGVTSAPSIEYVIYPNSDAQTITLAEAA